MKKIILAVLTTLALASCHKNNTYGYIPKGASIKTTFIKTGEKSWETVETIEVITRFGDTTSAYVSPATFEGKYFVVHRNSHPAVKDRESVYVTMRPVEKYNMITRAALEETH